MFTISANSKFPPPRAVATRRLNTARHFTLPYLIVLSLTTLILAVIYGYCVGQNNHHRSELLDPTLTSNLSTVAAPPSHHYARFVDVPSIHVFPRNVTTNSTGTTPASSTQPSKTAHVSEQSRVSLVFYSITLPISTLLHALTEATLLKWRPQSLIFAPKPTLFSIPYALLAASILLAYGWTVNTAFWTHCELALAHSSICPVQVRNHLMYGILELSIAKAAVGWALVAGYALHIFYLMRWMRVVKRWEGISGWAGQLEWEPEDKEGFERGEVELSGIAGMEDVEVKGKVSVVKVVAAAQEARAKKEREAREVAERYGPPKEAPVFAPPPTKPTK